MDPAVTNKEESDETGIIVAGIGQDKKGYIVDDLSGKYSPSEWAKKVIRSYHYYKADRVVAEINQGGDLVEQTIRVYDPTISYRSVRASKGKVARAEPVAALYEQGKIIHLGHFSKLEDQMCNFSGGRMAKSPDRVDALVWTLTELLLTPEKKVASPPKIWSF